MIDINQSPVLCPHTNKTNYHLNILPIFMPTVLFADPLWFGMYRDRGS